MSPEAAASYEAYAAYEKAQEKMSREEAVKVFSEVYKQRMTIDDLIDMEREAERLAEIADSYEEAWY